MITCIVRRECACVHTCGPIQAGHFDQMTSLCTRIYEAAYSDWLRAGRSSSPDRGIIFLLSTSSRPVLGHTPPHVQWVTGALSPWVKWPGREADHSPRTNAQVKKL
jgi:hypothetical protein